MIARLVKFADMFGMGFFAYFLVGLICALVEWSVFAASLPLMSPLLAACTGFIIATIPGWLLSRRFAFTTRRGYFLEYALIVLSSGAGFVFNLLVFLGLVYAFGAPLMIAKIAGTAVAFICNYAVRQFWVFSRTPRHQPMSATFQRWKNKRSSIEADRSSAPR